MKPTVLIFALALFAPILNAQEHDQWPNFDQRGTNAATGTQCEVEVTTNLPAPWTSLSTLTLTNGVGLIQTSSTNAQRYCRAKFANLYPRS